MKKNECVIIGQMDNFDFKFPDQNSFNLNDILHDPDMQTLFRLAVYGSLTRKFIHEINNSLTGIIGFNSLLLRNQNLSEKERVYVEKFSAFVKTLRIPISHFLIFFLIHKRFRRSTQSRKFWKNLQQICLFCPPINAKSIAGWTIHWRIRTSEKPVSGR